MKLEAIDLFCGAGGLTAGLKASGIDVKAGIDIDPACRYAYEANNNAKFINKSVTCLTAEEIRAQYSENSIKILAGCAPCQPFSKYTQGIDKSSDAKWPLLYEFSRLLKETTPDYVTMENVPEVVRHSVYHDFENSLKELGYQVSSSVVMCEEYGIPQSRRRCVLLASKHGKIKLVPPTHKGRLRSVKDAIGNLPEIAAGEADCHDPLHKAATLSALNMARIKHSKPGGTWRDWPDSIRANCHHKSSGKTYVSVYGRMEWNKPSPTITTLCYGYGNGRFGHPTQDRALSLREAAILQTFPKDYEFSKLDAKMDFRTIGRLIGNAVPVRLGEIIGRSILEHAYNHALQAQPAAKKIRQKK